MNTIKKVVITSATLAAALCFKVSPSQAQYYGDAPWCAVITVGMGVAWYCQYRTVEECVPNVLAGNRGFCNLNPWPVSNTAFNLAQ
jgi:hypothetical protein